MSDAQQIRERVEAIRTRFTGFRREDPDVTWLLERYDELHAILTALDGAIADLTNQRDEYRAVIEAAKRWRGVIRGGSRHPSGLLSRPEQELVAAVDALAHTRPEAT